MMSNFYKPDSTRLTKNTLLHYFRMALMMCIILYTSRIVLHILGVEDYGIFNVVGSVIIMFSFICEKPLILNPWNIDNLVEMELKTGHKAYTILQLRLHDAMLALNEGFRISEARPSIEIVSDIRNSSPIGLKGDYHPMARMPLAAHPFGWDDKR